MKSLKSIIPKGFDFTKEQWEDSFKNNKPLVVVPFISKRCNIDCIYCMMKEERNCYKGNGLTLKQHEKVLKDAYKLGCRTMVITGIGEPFMDPLFYDFKTDTMPLIDLAEKIGLYTIVFTNGQMISPKIAKILYTKKISLILKLTSFKKDVFEFLNNAPIKFEKYVCPDGVERSIPYYLKNLFDAGFGQAYENNTTRLIADVIITKQNIKEIPSIIDLSLKNNMLVCIDPLVIKSNALDNINILGITDEENKTLYKEVESTFSDYDMGMYDLSKCIIHHNGIVYDLDGNVRRCLSVPSDVGNVLEEPFEKLWDKVSKEKIDVTKKYENMVFEDIFGKCPGRCFYNFKNHS